MESVTNNSTYRNTKRYYSAEKYSNYKVKALLQVEEWIETFI